MAAIGGWIRLFIGLLLSVEVVKIWIFGGAMSLYGNLLAVSFILLTLAYFIFKF